MTFSIVTLIVVITILALYLAFSAGRAHGQNIGDDMYYELMERREAQRRHDAFYEAMLERAIIHEGINERK